MATKKVSTKTSSKVGSNSKVTQKTVKGKASGQVGKATMTKAPGKG
jgi:hypothetical protein